MGLFKSQLSNVVEWEEYKDDCIFWKWTNKEIKKGKPSYNSKSRTGCNISLQWQDRRNI